MVTLEAILSLSELDLGWDMGQGIGFDQVTL